jgi:hypothetical protein
MLKLFTSFFLLLLPFQDTGLKKHKLTPYVTMGVATTLRSMTQQELSSKFLGAKIPDAALTEQSSAVEFTITGSPTFWMEKDMVLLKEFYDSSIPALFSEIDFKQKEMVSIDDRTFVAYEFTATPVVEDPNKMPEKRYTYILYTIYRKGMVTISFSCPPYLQEEWKPIVQEMYKTIKFK